jgi:hypothetical protein
METRPFWLDESGPSVERQPVDEVDVAIIAKELGIDVDPPWVGWRLG